MLLVVLLLSPKEGARSPDTRLVVEAISKLHPEVSGSKDLNENRRSTGGVVTAVLLCLGLMLLSLLLLLLLVLPVLVLLLLLQIC